MSLAKISPWKRFAFACLSVIVFGIIAMPNGTIDAAPGDSKIKKVTDDEDLGTTVWLSLDNAPFPARSAHYKDNTVAVFVPKGFTANSAKSNTDEIQAVDFVIYYHGHMSSVDASLKSMKLREQLVDSGQNAVLVIPQGPKFARDSDGGKLSEDGGLKNLLEEILEVLQNPTHRDELSGAYLESSDGSNLGWGSIILSAHSGGYEVTAYSVKKGQVPISDVYLFDALYGGKSVFRNWLYDSTKDNPRKLISLYSEPTVRGTNKKLRAMLMEAGIGYVHSDGPRAVSYTLFETDGYDRNRHQLGVGEAVFAKAKSHFESTQWMTRCLKSSLALGPRDSR